MELNQSVFKIDLIRELFFKKVDNPLSKKRDAQIVRL